MHVFSGEFDDNFHNFYREFRERRKQSALKNSMNQHYRVKKARRTRAQAFYPCPPPSASELDNYESDSDDEFIDYSAVSFRIYFNICICMSNTC